MSTIFMYVDAFLFLCVDIACDIWTFVHYQYRFTGFFCFVRENCAVEAGADY